MAVGLPIAVVGLGVVSIWALFAWQAEGLLLLLHLVTTDEYASVGE